MASVPAVLRQIRRARRRSKRPPSVGRFERYEAEYETVLSALEELGGDSALDEVGEWAMEWTQRHERLPTPERFRRRAREALRDRDVKIPPNSPLYPPE